MRVSGPRAPFARDGGVGQGLFQPVLAEGVPLVVGQVSRRGGFQERLRQARSHPQPAGIHRRLDHRLGGGRGVAVPGQQLRRPGQELDHLPIRRRPGRQRHPRVCCPGELAHLHRGERGGHGDVVPGQQFPRLGMRIGAAGRAGGQGVPKLGPHGGQDQHRGPAGVAQQLPHPRRDPLPQPALRHLQVELGLIQPHHRPRPNPRQLGQRRIRAGRVDRMPHPPRLRLVPQHAQRLPARPGLARRGTAHQHRDPAPARRRRPYHPAQYLIMLARHVRRQHRQLRRRILRLDRPVHLQRERVRDLPQRPPRRQRARRDALPARRAGGKAGELGCHQVSELLRGAPAQVHRDHIGPQAGQLAVVEPGREHVYPGLGHRPAQRGPALQPGPGPGRVRGRDEYHHDRRLPGIDRRQLLSQILAPQLDLLISVVETAHPPRLQRRGDLPHVVPLRAGERQRHIPPPPRPSPPARQVIRARHDTRVCHRPDLVTRSLADRDSLRAVSGRRAGSRSKLGPARMLPL